ncbi:hypothetical protein I316_02056 [Kwoniella heveanensis BCC8398]|uniref:Uncharacterized protein n=1 Tax=Kwoniella heveanensis BCC8398 TaxID=1296120 RepID=A0A1B9GYV7_9TREE|nr:hypothetical protein I316_02056 [Kwoniella heveanensis BCC8398]
MFTSSSSFAGAENSYGLSQDSALFDFFRGDAKLTPFAKFSGGGSGSDIYGGEIAQEDEDEGGGYFGNWELSESLMVEQGYSVISHNNLRRSTLRSGRGDVRARSEGWDDETEDQDAELTCMTSNRASAPPPAPPPGTVYLFYLFDLSSSPVVTLVVATPIALTAAANATGTLEVPNEADKAPPPPSSTEPPPPDTQYT